MIDKEHTEILQDALHTFKIKEVDEQLKLAIDGALKNGLVVTMYYRGGSTQVFADGVCQVTPQTQFGDPIYIEATSAAAQALDDCSALTVEEQAAVIACLEEARVHLNALLRIATNLSLFEGLSATFDPFLAGVRAAHGPINKLYNSQRG